MPRFGSGVLWIWLVTGMAVIAAVGALLGPRVRDWASPPLARGLAAYAAGDWATAESMAIRRLQLEPRDVVATRLLARAYSRRGRATDALALELSLGSEHWEAEDLFLIGRRLVEDGRTVLGWAAFDAAAKSDPKHREAGYALVELGGKSRGLDVVRQVDLITAVPSSHGLAELLAGLIPLTRTDTKAGGFDPTLHRLFQYDRATFAAIDSRDISRKLLARLLLQAGRPAEARAGLERVSQRATDEETNWLLSRAYLSEGNIEQASAALERAGRYGHGSPLSPEPTVYVGAKSCGECHSAIFRTEQGGRHGQTVSWGKELATVPLPKGVVKDPADPKVEHRFERNGERITVHSRVGDQTIDALVGYALGSGHHGVTMLARDSSGAYRSLRISYYSAGDHWGITHGFEPHPADPSDFLGTRLSRENFQKCLNCHTTRFASEQDREGPEALDHGIGCEKCHGPGGNHLKAIAEGFPELAIARPKVASHSQRAGLCAQCHASDGKIPPSDPGFIRFQSTTLPYSRCVSESGGQLDCVSCHDPHTNLANNPAHYEARCLACHGERAPLPDSDRLLRLDAVAASRCKVNPRSDCLKCHMPKSENVLPFTTFTDHHIRVHRPAGQSVASEPGL